MHAVLSPASFTSLPSSLREKRKLGKVGLATSLQLSTTYLPFFFCHSRVDLVASEELARRAGPPLQVALAYRLELMKCGVCGPALLQKSQSSFSFIGKEGGVELPCGTAFDFLYYPSSSQRRGHGGRAGIQNSTVLLPAASSKRLPPSLKLFFQTALSVLHLCGIPSVHLPSLVLPSAFLTLALLLRTDDGRREAGKEIKAVPDRGVLSKPLKNRATLLANKFV